MPPLLFSSFILLVLVEVKISWCPLIWEPVGGCHSIKSDLQTLDYMWLVDHKINWFGHVFSS